MSTGIFINLNYLLLDNYLLFTETQIYFSYFSFLTFINKI